MSVWRGGFALGAIALAAAVSSGSRALGVVGVGFLLASLLTWLWTWIAESPVTVTYGIHPTPANEGDRVRIALEVRPPVPVSARFHDADHDNRAHRGADVPAACPGTNGAR